MRAAIPTLLLTSVFARAAGDFTFASSRYLELLSFTGVTGQACTISALFRHTGTPATRAVVAVSSATSERFQLEIGPTSNLVARAVNSAVASGTAFTGDGLIANDVWYHGVAVFTSTNSRAIYLNGVLVATNGTAIITANIDRVTIGARRNAGSYGAYFDGQVAAVGVWNVALTADEIGRLGNRTNPISPLRIRSQNLVSYPPLMHVGSSNTVNLVGAPFSNIAGVGNAEHPKVLWP